MEKNDLEQKIEYIKTSRNKDANLIDNKYIFNFSRIQANKSMLYRCSYYKKSSKCGAFIIIKTDNSIEEYEPKHYHKVEEIAGARARAKSEIKEKIDKIGNPFNIKANLLYKESIMDKGFQLPEYKSIRSWINRIINKIIPIKINDIMDINDQHDYYKTFSGEKFLLEKSSTFIIFQSEYQVSLHLKY